VGVRSAKHITFLTRRTELVSIVSAAPVGETLPVAEAQESFRLAPRDARKNVVFRRGNLEFIFDFFAASGIYHV
jgi:hypothetical protein